MRTNPGFICKVQKTFCSVDKKYYPLPQLNFDTSKQYNPDIRLSDLRSDVLLVVWQGTTNTMLLTLLIWLWKSDTLSFFLFYQTKIQQCYIYMHACMQFGVSSIFQDDLSLWLNLISATRAEVWRYFNDVVLYCRHQMASFEHYWDHTKMQCHRLWYFIFRRLWFNW